MVEVCGGFFDDGVSIDLLISSGGGGPLANTVSALNSWKGPHLQNHLRNNLICDPDPSVASPDFTLQIEDVFPGDIWDATAVISQFGSLGGTISIPMRQSIIGNWVSTDSNGLPALHYAGWYEGGDYMLRAAVFPVGSSLFHPRATLIAEGVTAPNPGPFFRFSLFDQTGTSANTCNIDGMIAGVTFGESSINSETAWNIGSASMEIL